MFGEKLLFPVVVTRTFIVNRMGIEHRGREKFWIDVRIALGSHVGQRAPDALWMDRTTRAVDQAILVGDFFFLHEITQADGARLVSFRGRNASKSVEVPTATIALAFRSAGIRMDSRVRPPIVQASGSPMGIDPSSTNTKSLSAIA